MVITKEVLLREINKIMKDKYPNVKVNFSLIKDGDYHILMSDITESDYLFMKLVNVDINRLLKDQLCDYPLSYDFRSGNIRIAFNVIGNNNNFELSHDFIVSHNFT